MKIAIVAPPFAAIPVIGHGGTERIVYSKIKELVKRGYEVEVFGCGNFKVPCKFTQIFPEAISDMKINFEIVEASRPLRLETAYLTTVMKLLSQRDGEFDVIFNHARGGYSFTPLFEKLKTPLISTFHLPLFHELEIALRNIKKEYLISISNAQRKNAPNLPYLETVYNGVDLDDFQFGQGSEDYLFFIGALGEHKSPHIAIEAAKKTSHNLIIAGSKKREEYYKAKVLPQIDDKQIREVGEVDGERKIKLYKNAKALIFPIRIDESFGLVMIEAMACGTPVIAFDKGAVKEVVEDGKTGFICPADDIECLIDSVNKIFQMGEEEYYEMRKNCRKRVEENFTTQIMVNNYLKAYKKVKNL